MREKTDEQKYLFDLRGWMLLPAVLTEQECAPIRDHLKSGGGPFAGPAQELLDHPAVVDILSEILGGGPCPEDHYALGQSGDRLAPEEKTRIRGDVPAIETRFYRLAASRRKGQGKTRIVHQERLRQRIGFVTLLFDRVGSQYSLHE